MKLKVNINEQDLQNQVLEKAKAMASSIAESLVTWHFSNGRDPGNKGAGLGYFRVTDRIDKYLTSPEFISRVDALIDKHMEQALEAAVMDATARAAKKAAHLRVAAQNEEH